MTTHQLKCWPQFFDAVYCGVKKFEVRKGNDRKYEVGDEVILREYEPEGDNYTGRLLAVKITYVMHGGPFLPEDTWVFGFKYA